MQGSWDHTVEGHRRAQREAMAATAWTLAQENGPFAVTMSQVAQTAGVSRPTLYKYFPDVEAMLIAHHRRHVEGHVSELRAILDGPGSSREQLDHLVRAYAEICHHRARQGDADLDRIVHSAIELDAAESALVDLFAQAIRAACADQEGLPASVLAAYCVRALAAAGDVPGSEVAVVAQLVANTLQRPTYPLSRAR